MKRKILSIISAVFIMLAAATIVSADDISVVFNDDIVEFYDAKPIIRENRVFVPIRAISEKMNCMVSWNAEEKSAELQNEKNIVKLQVGSKIITRTDAIYGDTENISADVAPFIEDNRIYFPLRALSESMGCNVAWNSANRCVSIKYYNLHDLYGDLIEADDISVALNGTDIDFHEAKPYVKNDIIFVPARTVLEKMDCSIQPQYEDVNMQLFDGERILNLLASVNNVKCEDVDTGEKRNIILDAAPFFKDNMIYIPLSVLSDCMGCNVKYDSDNKQVNIKYNILPDIHFDDEAMRWYVKNEFLYSMDEELIGKITQKMLDRIQYIDDSKLPEGMSFKSLEDIRRMPNLSIIKLSGKDIKDLSPLAYKEKYDVLDLENLRVEDDSALDKIRSADKVKFPNGVGEIDMISTKESPDEYYKTALAAYRAMIKRVREIENIINDNMNDMQKFKMIHDYLVNHMQYSLTGVENSEIPNPLYLALVKGVGICDTYAHAYESLCKYFGLNCVYVTGEAYGISMLGETPSWQSHAWNIVTFDGSGYHVDVTWDDPLGTSDTLRYDYFLLSDEELDALGTHKPEGEYMNLCGKSYRKSHPDWAAEFNN